VPWKWVEEADIWVMHRFIPPKLQPLMKDKGCVAVLHGVTEFMLIAENWTMGDTSEFNFHINLTWGKPQTPYDRAVVPNPQDYEIMKLYDENRRLRMIQEGVDLEYYTPDGYKWEYLYRPAIMSSDVPRFNKLPAHIIWAMPKIAEKIPTARLNIFSLYLENIVTWRNVLVRSKERRLQALTENVRLEKLNDLRPFYRGADLLFNCNMRGTACRNIQQALACGLPVVAYDGPFTDYTKWKARTWDLDSIAETIARAWDEVKADPEKARLSIPLTWDFYLNPYLRVMFYGL
jgi:glycosyltransferase involved in cell wall biosynthesis